MRIELWPEVMILKAGAKIARRLRKFVSALPRDYDECAVGQCHFRTSDVVFYSRGWIDRGSTEPNRNRELARF